MPSVIVPLAEECEELEAVTLIDILRRADIKVITASLSESTQITASRGVRLIADTTLDKVIYDDFEMILLPGGPGVDRLNADPRIHAILKRLYLAGKSVAAICAAPLVLAHAGLLSGKQVTCYPGVLNAADWPEIILTDAPVVIDGAILTSKGPGTAMDFALTIVEYLQGAQSRSTVEAGLVR